jgi:hypothetical protein
VLNYEGTHCDREKSGTGDYGDLKRDDKKEAEKNNEAERFRISGTQTAKKLRRQFLIRMSMENILISTAYITNALQYWQ